MSASATVTVQFPSPSQDMALSVSNSMVAKTDNESPSSELISAAETLRMKLSASLSALPELSVGASFIVTGEPSTSAALSASSEAEKVTDWAAAAQATVVVRE